MTATMCAPLTDNEAWVLNHTSMFGSDSYPVRKRGSRWYVDGLRGCGSFPTAFATKRQATAAWESYLGTLRDRKAGRL